MARSERGGALLVCGRCQQQKRPGLVWKTRPGAMVSHHDDGGELGI